MRRLYLLPTRSRPAFVLLALLLPLAVTGCGRKGTVSGKVTLNGQPLPAGNISFVPADPSKAQRAAIKDGAFRVEGIPTGTAKVVITPARQSSPGPGRGGPPLMGGGPIKDKSKPPEGVPPPKGYNPEGIKEIPEISIAEEYQTPEKTPLSFDVKGGTQDAGTFDVKPGAPAAPQRPGVPRQ